MYPYNMIDIGATNYQDEASGVVDFTTVKKSIPLYPSFAGWNYSMRRNMQEIIPGLYLGPYSAAKKKCQEHLLESGITHIICVRQDIEAYFIRPQFQEPLFTYLILDIADNVNENIIRFFPQVKQFINEAHVRNGKVLIHGNTGNSRSATLVLAYVMEKFGLSTRDAYQYVKERRACINPNEGFVAQLTEYEPIYKARQTLDKGESSCDNHRQKRKIEQLCETVDIIQPPSSPILLNNNQENYQPNTEFTNHVYRLLLKHS